MNHAYRWWEGDITVTLAICAQTQSSDCQLPQQGPVGWSPSPDAPELEKAPLPLAETAGLTTEVTLLIALTRAGDAGEFHVEQKVRLNGPKQQPFVMVD